jgi:hypothetical protein
MLKISLGAELSCHARCRLCPPLLQVEDIRRQAQTDSGRPQPWCHVQFTGECFCSTAVLQLILGVTCRSVCQRMLELWCVSRAPGQHSSTRLHMSCILTALLFSLRLACGCTHAEYGAVPAACALNGSRLMGREVCVATSTPLNKDQEKPPAGMLGVGRCPLTRGHT